MIKRLCMVVMIILLSVNCQIGLAATPVRGHNGPSGVLGPGVTPATKFRAIILKTPGYWQAVAEGSLGGRWVGMGLRLGHRNFGHALLGRVGGRGIVDLNPKGFLWSDADGTNGRWQVGAGQMPGDRGGALLWSGSARGVVLLNPRGFKFSQAISVRAGQEVGYVETSRDLDYAALWRGSAQSFINLNPKGFVSSDAVATDGAHQVGFGTLPNGTKHALIWRGSATSAVDINPRECAWSKAMGIGGGRVVGFGQPRGAKGGHAILWLEPGEKFVDLNPAGCAKSCGNGTNGWQEVGYGASRIDGMVHAMVWNGTSESAIDLQRLLPPRYSFSQAYAITSHGMIFGFAATRDRKSVVAVEWVPVKKVRVRNFGTSAVKE